MHVATRPQPCHASAPEGTRREQRMADGRMLVLRHWAQPDATRAVLLVHGLGEHCGRYGHTAAWFQARGYDVLAYDQRGHGLTPGPRAALAHPDDLLADLAAVYVDYASRAPALPLLLGHSMGGLVAARAVLDGRVTPAGLVLSSPAFRSHAAPWLQTLAAVLSRVMPNLPLRTGLPPDHLSHDAAVNAAFRDDALCTGRITPRMADFIFRAGAACIADASRLAVPTLLLAAGADWHVDPSGSRAFAAAACTTGHLTTRHFDTLYHELLNEAEPGRSQVLKQLGDWLARLPA